MKIFHVSLFKVFRYLPICWHMLVLVLFPRVVLANTGDDELLPPQQLESLWVRIPPGIQHLIDQDAIARVAIRLDEDGIVTDWIPLQLPHRKLWSSMEDALSLVRFSPARLGNTPIAVDMVIEIPVGQVNYYGVLTLDPLTYLETRLANMVPEMYQLVLTDANGLDFPLKIISRGNPVVPVDTVGNRIKGEVVVEFFVDIHGRPHMMDSDDSLHPVLRNAAHMTVEQFSFNKPTKAGKPIVTKAKILIRY